MANVSYSESAVHVTVALTDHTLEYPVVLPDGVKGIEFQCRDGTDIQYSFGVANKAKGSTDPYHTLKSGAVYSKDFLYLNATTIYFACGSDAKNVELTYWR